MEGPRQTKADQTALIQRQCKLWDTGVLGWSRFNLIAHRFAAFFATGSVPGAKRESNLRIEAADFRLPFRQPLLSVVWSDHQ